MIELLKDSKQLIIEMRVDNVNKNKKVGYIKFNSDAEMDLIRESMDRLIAKQERLVDRTRGDTEEKERLERFKKSKDSVIEIPKQNRMRIKAQTDKIKIKVKEENERKKKEKEEKIKQGKIKPDDPVVEEPEIDVEDTDEFKQVSKVVADSEVGSALSEGTEVTHRNMHVLAHALNDHIWEMEKDGLYKKTRRNQNKYDKLKQLLAQTQEQKAQFERQTPKPKGWGRLRK
jgi:hypothetical protein